MDPGPRPRRRADPVHRRRLAGRHPRDSHRRHAGARGVRSPVGHGTTRRRLRGHRHLLRLRARLADDRGTGRTEPVRGRSGIGRSGLCAPAGRPRRRGLPRRRGGSEQRRLRRQPHPGRAGRGDPLSGGQGRDGDPGTGLPPRPASAGGLPDPSPRRHPGRRLDHHRQRGRNDVRQPTRALPLSGRRDRDRGRRRPRPGPGLAVTVRFTDLRTVRCGRAAAELRPGLSGGRFSERTARGRQHQLADRPADPVRRDGDRGRDHRPGAGPLVPVRRHTREPGPRRPHRTPGRLRRLVVHRHRPGLPARHRRVDSGRDPVERAVRR